MEKKVHLKDPKYNSPKFHFDSRLRNKPEQLTEEPEKVTCKLCLKKITKGASDMNELDRVTNKVWNWLRTPAGEIGMTWAELKGAVNEFEKSHSIVNSLIAAGLAGAGDIKPRGLQDSAGTAVNPDDCLHCFCQKDTCGNLKCCKCGSILLVTLIEEAVKYGHINTPIS